MDRPIAAGRGGDYRIPLLIPQLPKRDSLARYINRIYTSRWLSNSGPLVRELEHRMAEHLDVESAIAVSSATMGILVLLHALDLPPGAQAAMPSFNFAAGPAAAIWNRLIPVLVDIEPLTLCMSTDSLELLCTGSTRLVMPVHTFGLVCDTEALKTFCDGRGLVCVYDAASALASRGQGLSIAKHGVASVVSLHATKILPAGEGGIILTDDRGLAEECRRILNFGFGEPGVPEVLGVNGKMSELTAALALAGFDQYHLNIEQREACANRYHELLAGVDLVELPKVTKGSHPVLHLFPVLVPLPCGNARVIAGLRRRGIECRAYYRPLHTTRPFGEYAPQSLPGTQIAAQRVICIPFYPRMKASDQRAVVDGLLEEVESALEADTNELV